VFSVNKMLRSLSNLGRGFCVGRSRVSREVWVSDFAMSGWVEMALRSRGLLLVAFWSRARSTAQGAGARAEKPGAEQGAGARAERREREGDLGDGYDG
jgi:hypothetical protein